MSFILALLKTILGTLSFRLNNKLRWNAKCLAVSYLHHSLLYLSFKWMSFLHNTVCPYFFIYLSVSLNLFFLHFYLLSFSRSCSELPPSAAQAAVRDAGQRPTFVSLLRQDGRGALHAALPRWGEKAPLTGHTKRHSPSPRLSSVSTHTQTDSS